jgi:orotidine-5'-phosphate decarboxylase
MAQHWPFAGLLRPGPLRDRVIVSLDMVDRTAALRLVDKLAPVVGMFKVGRSLFVGGGAEFVREVRKRGGEVFLDLKFRESPQGMVRSALEATRLGAKMFDVLPNVCPEVLARTRAEVSRLCRAEGLRRPLILAVAMLAGIAPRENRGPAARDHDCVIRLARAAAEAALDGVLTPAHEACRIRAACGRRFVVVASGISARGVSSAHALGAADAVRAGADYLVVGAQVCRSPEPVRAVRQFLEDGERALRMSPRASLEGLPRRFS